LKKISYALSTDLLGTLLEYGRNVYRNIGGAARVTRMNWWLEPPARKTSSPIMMQIERKIASIPNE
jgi:hypothetical protein